MDFTKPLPEAIAIRYFQNKINEIIRGSHRGALSFDHLDKRQRRRAKRTHSRVLRYRESIAWHEAEREAREDVTASLCKHALDTWLYGFAAIGVGSGLLPPYIAARSKS